MSTAATPPDAHSDGPTSLFPYDPARGAIYPFLILFFISGTLHALQTHRFKSWRFTVLFPWGAALYVASFAMRLVATFHLDDLGIFIAFSVLHYVAPPIYQAVNYFILGRVLHYVPYLSPIHPGRVVSTFVGLDVVVEIVVAQGASRVARWDQAGQVEIGLNLIKASLLLQLALFCGFLALQIIVHARAQRQGIQSRNLRSILRLLYLSNALILVRNLYRTVDAFLGTASITKRYEWYEYVFDSLPMLANALLLNAFFPAVYLPRSNKVYLGSDGRTARRGPGYKDTRPFLLTLFDPFDLVGLAMGKDAKTKFWEQEAEHPVVVSVTDEAEKGSGRSVVSKVLDPFNLGGFRASFSKPTEFKQLPAAAA